MAYKLYVTMAVLTSLVSTLIMEEFLGDCFIPCTVIHAKGFFYLFIFLRLCRLPEFIEVDFLNVIDE